MKNNKKSREKEAKRRKLIAEVDRKLELWERMKNGDTKALIEITIERGMAKKEDFEL